MYAGDGTGGTLLARTDYAYNLQGRMAEVTIDSDGDTTPDRQESYLYDDQGMRVSTTGVVDGVAETTDYVIDSVNLTGYAQVLEEWTVDEHWWHDQMVKSYTYGQEIISQYDGGVNYLMADGHGSVRFILGSGSGPDIYESYDYDAFGNLVAVTDGSGEALDPSGPLMTSILYTGQRFDCTTGLYNLRARYYEPLTGRFNRPDPYSGDNRNPLTFHKYVYCGCDPVNGTDPDGRYTRYTPAFGYEAEDQIDEVYRADHPRQDLRLGNWTRLPFLNLCQLKPDILNVTKKRWLEIKPLSPSGISEADLAILKYAPMMVFGYYPDAEWKPSRNQIEVRGRPAWFVNTGAIVFYTSDLAMRNEFVMITSIYMARVLMQRIRQLAVTSTRLVIASTYTDQARGEQEWGIASILATIGGVIL